MTHSFDVSANHFPTVEASRVRDYFALLKPRVMSLVVFSGIVGEWLAPGSIHPLLAMVAILCIAIGAGAAGAINMWYDRDIDAIMQRTQKRPIPAGRVAADDALQFGVILSTASVLIMGLALNITAALLLAVAILFYVFVYTMWLKRNTPQNIVIGGAAGAFPPMIGWAAVTGNISIESCILFLIIFMWTPPHFWALALYKSDDYKKANVPMMPVTCGQKVTKQHMIIYTLLLILTSLLPVIIHMSGILYGLTALLLGAKFLHYAICVYKDEHNKYAPRMFGYSILYLFLILGFLVLDRLVLGI